MKGKRILLLEDDPEMSKLVRTALEMEGAQLLEVDSVESAINNWGAFRPDLVISDNRMPRAQGLEFVRYLRERVQIPVVMFTTVISPEIEAAAKELFSTVVPKDRFETLMKSIKQALGQKA